MSWECRTHFMSEVRSHQGANNFFMKLVDWATRCNRPVFTYIDVTYALSMNLQYVSKMLSRLARRRLLCARRIIRLDRYRTKRGFMNEYKITMRGWQKAAYLTGRQVVEPRVDESRDDLANMIGLSYLSVGKGMNEEWALAVDDFAIAHQSITNVGKLLRWLDVRFASVETWRTSLKQLGMQLPLLIEAMQAAGLTPTDVCSPPQYARLASYLGRTELEIVIALLYRRCRELEKQLNPRT